MQYGRKYIFVVGLAALGLTIFIAPGDVWARAGGGSARGGGWIGLVLLPIALLLSGILAYLVAKKHAQSKALLEKISQKDQAWETNALQARVEEAFFRIQDAWSNRNQDSAKEYMSKRLYDKHKFQTDRMIQHGTVNVMENINLKSAKIVNVADYRENSKDYFWVYIDGSMMDYTVAEKTGEIIDGKKKDMPFKELWRFKRENNAWVVDEIDQSASIPDLLHLNPHVE